MVFSSGLITKEGSNNVNQFVLGNTKVDFSDLMVATQTKSTPVSEDLTDYLNEIKAGSVEYTGKQYVQYASGALMEHRYVLYVLYVLYVRGVAPFAAH